MILLLKVSVPTEFPIGPRDLTPGANIFSALAANHRGSSKVKDRASRSTVAAGSSKYR
jgi:hypothetical protein